MQWVSVLGSVENDIVEAFTHGRGVPYERYGRFNEVMADDSGQTTICGLDEHIIPHVEGLHDRLTRGIDVVDIGCGAGRALMHLAKRYPASRFVGLDLQPSVVESGRSRAIAAGLTNLTFQVCDLTTWDGDNAFDLVTAFDAIHDQAKPADVLRRVHDALKPGTGLFLMQDIKASSHVHQNCDHPFGAFVYAISTMHCMSVSLANGGPGLGAAWGKELALQMLKEAGFGNLRCEELPHDPINYYYTATPL